MSHEQVISQGRKEKEKDLLKEKLTKAEKLERAAKGRMKMTAWLLKKENRIEEWDDDLDLPELEEVGVGVGANRMECWVA